MLVALGKEIPFSSFPFLADKLEWFRAELARRQGKMEQAARWMQTSGLRYDDEISLVMMKQYELLAVLLAEQENTMEA